MSPTELLIAFAVFASVFLLTYGIFRYPVPAAAPVHRRIARAVGADTPTIFEQPGLAPVLSLATSLAGRLNLPRIRRNVRQDLDASGNAAGYTVEQYLAIALCSSLITAVVGGLIESALGGGLLLVIVPIAAVVGFYLPLWMLHAARERRVMAIAKQLPYTLDLVALVMAAGSGFQEAVETLIRDEPGEELNLELQVALSEMEYGATRAKALKNVAERIPLESLRSVVAAVNQSEKLGTPMSAILKLQADMLRSQRGVTAEKKSASASLRILIPSMMIMISVVTILFAPMIIRYIQGDLF